MSGGCSIDVVLKGLRALLLGVFLLGVQPASAQEDSLPPARHLHAQIWKELTAELDYTEKPPKRTRKKRGSRGEGSIGFDDLFKLLIGALILGLLVFVFHRMSKSAPGEKPSSTDSAQVRAGLLHALEENLPEAELGELLPQALQEGDFRSAVRIVFLQALQKLALEQRIAWARHKTNGEYLQELQHTPLREPFHRLILLYERAWYGRAPLRRTDFERAQFLVRQLLEPRPSDESKHPSD